MKHWQEVIYYNSPPFVQNLLITAERYLQRPKEYGPVFREYRARSGDMKCE